MVETVIFLLNTGIKMASLLRAKYYLRCVKENMKSFFLPPARPPDIGKLTGMDFGGKREEVGT